MSPKLVSTGKRVSMSPSSWSLPLKSRGWPIPRFCMVMWAKMGFHILKDCKKNHTAKHMWQRPYTAYKSKMFSVWPFSESLPTPELEAALTWTLSCESRLYTTIYVSLVLFFSPQISLKVKPSLFLFSTTTKKPALPQQTKYMEAFLI